MMMLLKVKRVCNYYDDDGRETRVNINWSFWREIHVEKNVIMVRHSDISPLQLYLDVSTRQGWNKIVSSLNNKLYLHVKISYFERIQTEKYGSMMVLAIHMRSHPSPVQYCAMLSCRSTVVYFTNIFCSHPFIMGENRYQPKWKTITVLYTAPKKFISLS